MRCSSINEKPWHQEVLASASQRTMFDTVDVQHLLLCALDTLRNDRGRKTNEEIRYNFSILAEKIIFL